MTKKRKSSNPTENPEPTPIDSQSDYQRQPLDSDVSVPAGRVVAPRLNSMPRKATSPDSPLRFISEGDYAKWAAMPYWTAFEALSLLSDQQMPPYTSMLGGFTKEKYQKGRRDNHTRSVLERENADPDMETLKEHVNAAIAEGAIKVFEDNSHKCATPKEWIRWATSEGIAVPEPLRKLAAESSVPHVDSGGNADAPTNTDRWLTVSQAAIEAKLSSSAISHACSDGRLRFVGKGRQRRICPNSLNELVENNAKYNPYYLK